MKDPALNLTDLPKGSGTTTAAANSPVLTPGADTALNTPLPMAENPVDAAVEEDSGPMTRSKMVLVTIALWVSLFVAALDLNLVGTILPTITKDYKSSTGYVWIGSGYSLGATVSSPIWTKLSDIWGRKQIVLLANFTFLIGSVLCGAAPNLSVLILGRVIQGLGGGGVLVMPTVCISDLVAMRNRPNYFAALTTTFVIANSAGPAVGGVFADKISWRWAFYINGPLTGISMVVIFFFLNVHNPRTPIWDGLKAIDWLGTLTVIAGIVLFLTGIELGGVQFAWNSPTIICLIIFGIVCLGIFAVIEAYVAPFPLIPMRLFTKKTLPIIIFAALHPFILNPSTYFLPTFFQAVYGASALDSGLWILHTGFILALTNILASIWISKTGKIRTMVWISFGAITLGTGLFIDFGVEKSWVKIFLYQAIYALGFGPIFPAGLLSMQSQVSVQDAAIASAIIHLLRNLFTSISIVMSGAAIQNFLVSRSGARMRESLGSAAEQYLDGNLSANVLGIKNLPAEQQQVVRESVTDAMRYLWVVLTACAGVALIATLFMPKPVLKTDHTEFKTGLATLAGRKLKESCVSTPRPGSQDDLENGTGTDPEKREGKDGAPAASSQRPAMMLTDMH